VRPVEHRATRDRLLSAVTPLIGSPRVVTARRVLDRFSAVDGGLLAAGIAYNAVLALIPLGLLASGLAGVLLTDPNSRADVIGAMAALFPPLGGVVDEIVGGLSRASPSRWPAPSGSIGRSSTRCSPSCHPSWPASR
jgi:uncharacterized BrkB/YihY/UPF0761 family membrane protein